MQLIGYKHAIQWPLATYRARMASRDAIVPIPRQDRQLLVRRFLTAFAVLECLPMTKTCRDGLRWPNGCHLRAGGVSARPARLAALGTPLLVSALVCVSGQ